MAHGSHTLSWRIKTKGVLPMPEAKNAPADPTRSGPGRLVLAAGVGLAVVAGAATLGPKILASGPDAPAPVAAITVNPLADDAPIQQLGAEAPEGSWQRGVVTEFSFTDEPNPFPRIQIDASQIETGSYHYRGEVVLAGDLETPGVKITAGAITVNGSINADFVSLETNEAAPVQTDPEYMVISGLNHRELLVAFQEHYARGPIDVTGSVTGDAISLDGGTITVGGDARGDIQITGSTGENARAVIGHEEYARYQVPFRFQDGVDPAHFTSQERMPLPMGDEPTVIIAGSAGPDVTIAQGGDPVSVATATTAVKPTRTP